MQVHQQNEQEEFNPENFTAFDGGTNECPPIDLRRCNKGNEGSWESLPDSPIFVVHAALMHARKVLLFSGGAEVGYPLESRVWDPKTGDLQLRYAVINRLLCIGIGNMLM